MELEFAVKSQSIRVSTLQITSVAGPSAYCGSSTTLLRVPILSTSISTGCVQLDILERFDALRRPHCDDVARLQLVARGDMDKDVSVLHKAGSLENLLAEGVFKPNNQISSQTDYYDTLVL